MGGYVEGASNNYKYHYKWDGSNWVSVSILPFELRYDNKAVVFNNEIHIVGFDSSYSQKHYKYNGSNWVSVSKLPYNPENGHTVVTDGVYIYIGGAFNDSYKKYFYRFDPSSNSWSKLEDLKASSYSPTLFYFNNKIYMYSKEYPLYGDVYSYSYNSWSKSGIKATNYSSMNPYGNCCVFNGEIYMVSSGQKDIYLLDRTQNLFVLSTTVPNSKNINNMTVFNDYDGSQVLVAFGRADDNVNTYTAQYDGTSWTIGEDT